MKSTIKITAVVLAVCAAAFFTVSAITQRAEPDASEMYVLRDYNGRIAVFACGEDGGGSLWRYSIFSPPPCPKAKRSASTRE